MYAIIPQEWTFKNALLDLISEGVRQVIIGDQKLKNEAFIASIGRFVGKPIGDSDATEDVNWRIDMEFYRMETRSSRYYPEIKGGLEIHHLLQVMAFTWGLKRSKKSISALMTFLEKKIGVQV